jgi:hypothetical protein
MKVQSFSFSFYFGVCSEWDWPEKAWICIDSWDSVSVCMGMTTDLCMDSYV